MHPRFIAVLPLVFPLLSACTGLATHKSVYTPPDPSQPSAQLIAYPDTIYSRQASASLQRREFECSSKGWAKDEWTDLVNASYWTQKKTSVQLTLPAGLNHLGYTSHKRNEQCNIRFAATFEAGHVYAIKMESDIKTSTCSVSMTDTTTGEPVRFDGSNMGYTYEKALCPRSKAD